MTQWKSQKMAIIKVCWWKSRVFALLISKVPYSLLTSNIQTTQEKRLVSPFQA